MKELYWTIFPKQEKSQRQCSVSIANRGKTACSVVRVEDQTIVRQLRTGFALSQKDIELLRWLGKHLKHQQAIDVLAAYKFMEPVTIYNDHLDPQSCVTTFRQPRYFPCRAAVLINRAMVDCIAVEKNIVGDILCVTMKEFRYADVKGRTQTVRGIGVFQVPGDKVISTLVNEKTHSG
ncbi:MAG: hypothetical protein OEZ68_05150 [Gammaproteobacteria bacterium]|nr:hypothetical protein [Gammaproteobacteria bacterium]MDH5800176.1 hypothetical protein [Gammaproteobacteria bacterium]